MISWILGGALSAVLLAEIVDAVAVHRLARRCAGLHASGKGDARLIHWYAEGFGHSELMALWLRGATLVLMALAILCSAHPIVIVASAVLALAAHGERHISAVLRRRFQRV